MAGCQRCPVCGWRLRPETEITTSSSTLYWNGQLVWTPALGTLFVGDRGLYPAGIIAHLRLYRHIRQAAIRDVFFICSRFPRGHYLLWLVRFSLV